MTARLECLIIADDLTGACDSAVSFATRGYRTAVRVSDAAEETGSAVLSLSTDSRDRETAEIARAMGDAARSTPFGSARVLFKKIDSTLRGRLGTELAAALEAFECDAAVVCPAFPKMNRVVEAGRLHGTGAGDFEPVDVAGHLRSQGMKGCVHVDSESVAEAILSGNRFVSLDARSDDDLDRIAAACLALPRRILWAGSAGMAGALARTLPLRREAVPEAQIDGGPVLFGIGSDHPVTIDQLRRLLAARPTCQFFSENATRESIGSALGSGEHVLLRIPRGLVTSERILELIAGAPVRALVLSGGDTASLVCRSTRVRHIDLCDEIVPGVPRGVIGGGEFAGLPVVTKSGGFGDPGTLIRVADYFACRN